MADDDRNFSSQFRKGWEETWLSFGKWLGGCAPVLIILGILFVLLIFFAIIASSSGR